MDLVIAGAAVLVGAFVGAITGLVPGLHVNTLAAALALAPARPEYALGIIAVGTVHTFVTILPATYLGAPGEDTALATLPAHRMLMDGLGPAAVHLSAHASLLGLLVAVLMMWPYQWLLVGPLNLAVHLHEWVPWIAAATLVVLLGQEAHRSRTRILPAAFVMAAAAWLGWHARTWPVVAYVDIPATPLLPLLAGLFGVPTLLAAILHESRIPMQTRVALHQPVPRGASAAATRGVLAALGTAVLPGLTAAVATALARPFSRQDDPRAVVATLSAVNTAHSTLALAVLWIILRPRTGLAMTVETLLPVQAWQDHVPPHLVLVVGAVLAAGLLGYLATLLLNHPIAAATGRIPGRTLHGGALTLVVAMTTLLAGLWGLLLLMVATLVGALPLTLGVRRVNLAAALLVPIAIA